MTREAQKGESTEKKMRESQTINKVTCRLAGCDWKQETAGQGFCHKLRTTA